MNRQRMRDRCAVMLLTIAVGVLAVGCQTTQSTDAEAARFQSALSRTTQAINGGDLEQARTRFEEEAEAEAVTDADRVKIASLDRLITGAEALMTGDVPSAANEWSMIDDPMLSREVKVKAREAGMVVRARKNESEDTE